MGKMARFQIFMFSILFITIFSVEYIYRHTTQESLDVHILDKKDLSKDSDVKYLIYTENEIFEDTNSLFHKKYNSTEIYNDLKKGCSYKIGVFGIAIPIFKSYRNIVTIKKNDKPCLKTF